MESGKDFKSDFSGKKSMKWLYGLIPVAVCVIAAVIVLFVIPSKEKDNDGGDASEEKKTAEEAGKPENQSAEVKKVTVDENTATQSSAGNTRNYSQNDLQEAESGNNDQNNSSGNDDGNSEPLNSDDGNSEPLYSDDGNSELLYSDDDEWLDYEYPGDEFETYRDYVEAHRSVPNENDMKSGDGGNCVFFDSYDKLGAYKPNCPSLNLPVAEYDKQQFIDEYNNSDPCRFGHDYDYTIDFGEVSAILVADNITVAVMNYYTNETGYMGELFVVRPADMCYEEKTGRKFEFAAGECICSHIYKDNQSLQVGETYKGNMFLASDGSRNEWWEFVPEG